MHPCEESPHARLFRLVIGLSVALTAFIVLVVVFVFASRRTVPHAEDVDAFARSREIQAKTRAG